MEFSKQEQMTDLSFKEDDSEVASQKTLNTKERDHENNTLIESFETQNKLGNFSSQEVNNICEISEANVPPLKSPSSTDCENISQSEAIIDRKDVSQSNNDEVQIIPHPDDCEVKVISDSNSPAIEIISEFRGNSNETPGKESSTSELKNESSLGSKIINKATNYRCGSDSWSEDESDSSSSSDTSSDSDFFKMIIESSVPKKLPEVKTKGEIGLDELPPIEDLTITVYEEEMMLIGKIHAVVDKLVVVHALKDLKALDLDSVLFLSYNKPLGRVFDVFGPVVQPFYCVRFNSVDHINEKGIEVGGDVFFAPEKSDITSYVFVDELQKQKGSDASWKYNNEPPEECLDFSDDEQEKAAKRKRINKNRNRQFSNSSDVATKRPNLTGESKFRTPAYNNSASPRSAYQPRSAFQPRSTFQPRSAAQPISLFRHNPFSSPFPPPSPTPSVCSVMSMPVRGQNRFFNPSQPRTPFQHHPRQFPPQNALQRPPPPPASPLLLPAPYPSPHVFGQVTLFNNLMSPMQSPSPFQPNVPTLISGPVNPENFHPRFTRTPNSQGNYSLMNSQRFTRSSNVNQGHRIQPDPWLPNHSPNSVHVPPNYPLTVQIPNSNTSPLPANPFQTANVTGQPFMYNGNGQPNFFM